MFSWLGLGNKPEARGKGCFPGFMSVAKSSQSVHRERQCLSPMIFSARSACLKGVANACARNCNIWDVWSFEASSLSTHPSLGVSPVGHLEPGHPCGEGANEPGFLWSSRILADYIQWLEMTSLNCAYCYILNDFDWYMIYVATFWLWFAGPISTMLRMFGAKHDPRFVSTEKPVLQGCAPCTRPRKRRWASVELLSNSHGLRRHYR
jgi:hypothetical protein